MSSKKILILGNTWCKDAFNDMHTNLRKISYETNNNVQLVERGASNAKVPGLNPGWSVIFSLTVIYAVW